MGTSSSYGGPGDRTPLLPTWALPPDGTETLAPETPAAPPEAITPDGGVPTEPSPDAQPPQQTPPEEVPPSTGTAPASRVWTSARSSLTRALSSRSTSAYRRAARNYVRASRASGRAAGGATAGRRAVAALGGFISSAASRGFDAALAGIGLTRIVGRDVTEVLAAIVNALSPDGVTKEEVAARRAVSDTLKGLYEQLIDDGRDLSALESMSREDAAAAIVTCVESYIFNRWLGDLGIKIEEQAISASEAVILEREIKDFIHATVTLDLTRVDVLTLDWQGGQGQRFVENIYRDAYTLFGGEA